MDAVLESDVPAILLHHLCQKQTHTGPGLSMGGSCMVFGVPPGERVRRGTDKTEGNGWGPAGLRCVVAGGLLAMFFLSGCPSPKHRD
eukprot:6723036-Prorocentrum_lima.AAC.1